MARYFPYDGDGGGAIFTSMENNRCLVNELVLASPVTITRGEAYLHQSSGAQNAKIVVYDATGAAGRAGALLQVTPGFSVANAAAASVGADFSAPFNLAAGTYWIGVVANSSSVCVHFLNGGAGRWNLDEANSYASPLNPMGTPEYSEGSIGARSYSIGLIGAPTPTPGGGNAQSPSQQGSLAGGYY